MDERREAVIAGLARTFWFQYDQQRRVRGAWMEALGFGPVTTPARAVGQWSTARLLAYQSPATVRPAILLIPAPIKFAYVWDLDPDVSVIQRCLKAGLQVYMIEWQRPRADDETLGLTDYADRLILACIDAIAREIKQSKLYVAGHSLGGTLAAIFACLHPNRVQGLISLEGPMCFSEERGRIESAVQGMLTPAITRDFGNIPGSFLSMAGVVVDPIAFEWEPWFDWFSSQTSRAKFRHYWQANRWALDEMPMPKRLFEEVVDALYRENRFARGALHLDGRFADPRALTAPILAVADPRSRVVPPESVYAYRDHTGSDDVEIVEYEGDAGVMLQHVGVLIGEQAHKNLWPYILRWVGTHVRNLHA